MAQHEKTESKLINKVKRLRQDIEKVRKTF